MTLTLKLEVNLLIRCAPQQVDVPFDPEEIAVSTYDL